MIRSKVLQLAALAALTIGVQSAQACSMAAWTGATPTLTTGEPAQGFSRMAGRCSAGASAAGNKVVDNSPSAELAMNLQFHFYTGGLAGGEADILQAKNASATNILRVTYDGSLASPLIRFYVNGTAVTTTVPVLANRYYGIQIRWNSTGTFTAFVQTPGVPARVTVTQNGITGGQIDSVEMGWLAGGSLPGGATRPFFDEYDSRRTSLIPHLCFGNANNDTNPDGSGILGTQDRIVMTNEIAGSSLASGSADFNGDGVVGTQDRILLTNAIASSAVCLPTN